MSKEQSDSRALLEDQIKALNDLRDSAEFAITHLELCASLTRPGHTPIIPAPPELARLCTRTRLDLENALERAEHLLGQLDEDLMPTFFGEVGIKCRSACAGVYGLLFDLTIHVSTLSHAPEPQPLDENSLAEAIGRAGVNSIPFPTNLSVLLDHLLSMVHREVSAGIERQTQIFYHACNAPERQMARPAAAAAQDSKPVDVVSRLKDRHVNALEAMIGLKAKDYDSRRNAQEIAVKADGPQADADSYKRPLADLAQWGYAGSEQGQKGGSWFTQEGKAALKQRKQATKKSRIISASK